MEKLSFRFGGRGTSGMTFVEVLLGMTVLVFTLAICISGFQHLVRAEVSNRLSARVDKEIQSVAEQVRYQTAGAFDSMTETTPHVRPTSDPKIQVLSTIDPIDPATRTRKVTLIASWNQNGTTRTKTLSFGVSQMRAKLEGATVIIQAVDANTAAPLSGIQVSARGQDIDFVSGQTDANGVLQLQGVRLNALTSEELVIDGTASRAYHDIGTGQLPNGTRSFLRSYLVATHTSPPTYLTVPMVGPGRILGRVTDTFGNPVPNAQVYIYPKSGSQDVTYELTSNERFHQTDFNGEYVLPRVVQGRYYVYMTGDAAKTMTAVALENDRFDYNNGNYVVVLSTAETRANFTTTRRGNAVGTVRVVTGNIAGDYSLNGSRAVNLPLSFAKRDIARARLVNGGIDTQFWFGNSFSWWVKNTYLGDEVVTALTSANGDYRFNSIAPYIVHQDNTIYPQDLHRSPVRAATGETVPAPYLPVLAYAPNGFAAPTSNVKFLISYNRDYSSVRPKNLPEDEFVQTVIANRDNTQDIFVLSRDVLANIHGRVYMPDGVTPFPFDGQVVLSAWTPDGPANAANVGTFRWDTNRFESDYTFNTSRDGSNNVVFDLKQSGSNALLPNLGGDVTWIKFKSQVGGRQNGQKDLADSVKAWTKIPGGGGTFQYVQLSTANINVHNVHVEAKDAGGAVLWSDDTDINNGWLSLSNRPTHFYNFHTSSAAVSLKPGEDRAANMTVSPMQSGGYDTFYISLGHDEWVNTQFAQSPGAPLDYHESLNRYALIWPDNFPMELKKILRANVSGTVRDAISGLPLAGVTITIRRTSGNGRTQDQAPFAPLTATTGADGSYSFSAVTFAADPNPNIYVKPVLDGFEAVDERASHAYDGISITQDFSMMPVGTGGGGSGL